MVRPSPWLALGLPLLLAAPIGAQDRSTKSIVFVCEHGSVKSIIAAQWFNRMAAERGAHLRGVSRGLEPDAQIPEAVAANLRKDGFDLTGVTPVRLQEADLTQVRYVVAIGVKSPLLDKIPASLQRWDDIPPASANYSAARDAMRAKIAALLDTLAPPTK